MRVFISSVIKNFAEFRTAARNAVRALNLEPLAAEDFGARPESPQVACLEGVRRADAMVVLLGESYGARQQSGLSATHEEFREGRERRPVFAFIRSSVDAETQQSEFIREVQSWASGVYTASFTDPADLQRLVTSALHEWLVSQASGGVDEKELMSTADGILLSVRASSWQQDKQIVLVTVGGPTQSLLRPIQLEDENFSRNIRRRLLDDETGIFTSELGTTSRIEGHTLHFEQQDRFFEIDEQGSIIISLPMSEIDSISAVLIEEDIREKLRLAARFAATILESIDPIHRVTHVLLAAKIEGAEHAAWRTRAEHAASPNNICSGHDTERRPVTLYPATRARPVLNNEAEALADDLMVLLRRQYKSHGDRRHR